MKKKKIHQYYEKLKKEVEKVTHSKEFLEFLKFQSKFRKYSFANTMLIYSQKKDATYVAGLRVWNKLGRKVKKKEKGIAIFVPLIKKVRKEEKQDKEPVEKLKEPVELEIEVEGYKLVGFKIGYVFDITQTEGKPVPELDISTGYKSKTDLKALYNRLIFSSPVPVEYKKLSGPKGYYTKIERKIVLSTALSEEEKVVTLLHELAHHFSEDIEDRIEAEVVAEGAAYIVAEYFGIDSLKPASNYIAGWSKDFKAVVKAGERMRNIANRIISLIEGEELREAAQEEKCSV